MSTQDTDREELLEPELILKSLVTIDNALHQKEITAEEWVDGFDNCLAALEEYTASQRKAAEIEGRLYELGSADIAMDASGINETEEWEEYYDKRYSELQAQKEAMK